MNARSLLAAAIFFLSLTFSGELQAQNWAQKMFEGFEHDFGVVAAGSDAVHRFELKNIFEEDIHIAAVRSSCGCTTPSIEKQLLKTFESGAIIARFNTATFRGPKQATLTVTIDRPYFAEVQLIVKGNIQGNVSFEPGSVQFGDIMVGNTVKRTIRLSQRGNPGWQVMDVKTTFDDSRIMVDLRETGRVNGIVTYELDVELKGNNEPGYVNGELFIETNEGIRYPLVFSGRVAPPLEISPKVLALAPLMPGQEVRRRVLLKAERPFRVTRIESSDPSLRVEARGSSDRVQVLDVTYKANGEPGKHECRATIITDLGQAMTAELTAMALVEDKPLDLGGN